jgi:hypothetical protein
LGGGFRHYQVTRQTLADQVRTNSGTHNDIYESNPHGWAGIQSWRAFGPWTGACRAAEIHAVEKMAAKRSTTEARHDGIGIPSAIPPFAVAYKNKHNERTKP